MQPGPDQPTNVQDSVVGRDMHTGNVIHNHYHLPPTPQPAPPPSDNHHSTTIRATNAFFRFECDPYSSFQKN